MMRRCILHLTKQQRLLLSVTTSHTALRKLTSDKSSKQQGCDNIRTGVICAGLTLGAGCVIYTLTRDKRENKLTMFQKSMRPVLHAASPFGPAGDGHNHNESLRNKYNFIAEVVERASPAVVHIVSSTMFRQGAGSGFIISQDGLIVTNAHVVQSARKGVVDVEMVNGKKYKGVIQVIDSVSDLALVKIEEVNLPTLQLGSSGSLRPGEWVVAVGSPLALSNTVTSGIVSSTGRKSKELGLSNNIDYIQTDAPITFGNSGGPLINLDGEAVGVNSMKVTDGISFAIPSDYVRKFLRKADEFKNKKEMKRRGSGSYIGITSLTLNPRLSAQLRMRPDLINLDIDSGVFVVAVMADSPAQKAGIQRYDIIIKIDGENITAFDDLLSAVHKKSQVSCTVYRFGKIMEIIVNPTSS